MKKHDDLLVISDGFISYQTSFPEVFGRDYKVNTDPQSGECDLEMLLDTAQPGWRDVTIQRVFFPRIEAVGALPTAACDGFAGRPTVDAAGVAGVYLAGDWVGSEGFLADASFASASVAAERILEERTAKIQPRAVKKAI